MLTHVYIDLIILDDTFASVSHVQVSLDCQPATTIMSAYKTAAWYSFP